VDSDSRGTELVRTIIAASGRPVGGHMYDYDFVKRAIAENRVLESWYWSTYGDGEAGVDLATSAMSDGNGRGDARQLVFVRPILRALLEERGAYWDSHAGVLASFGVSADAVHVRSDLPLPPPNRDSSNTGDRARSSGTRELTTSTDFLGFCAAWQQDGRAPFGFGDWLEEQGFPAEAEAARWAADQPDRPKIKDAPKEDIGGIYPLDIDGRWAWVRPCSPPTNHGLRRLLAQWHLLVRSALR